MYGVFPERKAQRTALRFGDDADDDSPIRKHNGTRHGMEEGRNIECVQGVPLQLSTGIARAPFLRDNEPDPTGPSSKEGVSRVTHFRGSHRLSLSEFSFERHSTSSPILLPIWNQPSPVVVRPGTHITVSANGSPCTFGCLPYEGSHVVSDFF